MYALIRRGVYKKRDAWHSRRAALFVERMRPLPGASVLDLGGQDGEFMQRVAALVDVKVTIADIGETALAKARERGFRTVSLEEGEPLPFSDAQFDMVFCNSVIEHVHASEGGLRRVNGSETANGWPRASRASACSPEEVRRVGRSYFLQTPHRDFPIEAHTWLPFVGWMPHDATVRVVRLSDRYWVKHCGYVDWNLLNERDLRALFPDATIEVERVLGLPKSLIAYEHANALEKRMRPFPGRRCLMRCTARPGRSKGSAGVCAPREDVP